MATPHNPAPGARRRRAVRVLFALGGVALLASVAAGMLVAFPPTRVAWTPPPAPVLSPGKDRVQLLFTGDLSVARGIAAGIEGPGQGDPAWIAQPLGSLLADADLTFANLECVLSDSDAGRVDKTWTIRAPTQNARRLKDIGIDVVSVANNHALDFSHTGFGDTLRTLDAEGVAVTGVQQRGGQQPLIVPVGTATVGFLGTNAIGDEAFHLPGVVRPERFVLDETLRAVRALRARVDVVVVSIHWGPELSLVPTQLQQEQAHALVDAGADLVIGHHPHVPQPVEEYGSGLIAYSLGDLVFDKTSPWLRHRTARRFFLQVTLENKKRVNFALIPVVHDDTWRPRVDAAQDTASFRWPEPARATRQTGFLSGALASLRVTRTRGAITQPCDAWQERPAALRAGWLRWLAPRLVCAPQSAPPEESAPRAIAQTAELSAGVLGRGLWVSPDDDVVTLQSVGPLPRTLAGHAAYPDWSLVPPPDGSVPVSTPTRVTVKVDDRVVHEQAIAPVPGWHALGPMETGVSDSAPHTLVVEVAGARRPAPGFVLDLWW